MSPAVPAFGYKIKARSLLEAYIIHTLYMDQTVALVQTADPIFGETSV